MLSGIIQARAVEDCVISSVHFEEYDIDGDDAEDGSEHVHDRF